MAAFILGMAKQKNKNQNKEVAVEPETFVVNESTFFQKRKTLLISLLLAILCLAIYAQTFWFDFINIDDRPYVYENRAVINGLYSKTIYWAFTSFYEGNWHPLTWLSLMLDFTLFGLNPGIFHAENVLFHLINSILTLLVFHKLTGDFIKSAFVAALFAVHPAHVESVAWIAERKDVLSTMFWLLTMWAYFRWNEEGSKMTSKYYFAVIGFFILGLMSKSMLVTLPFVLLLCDYWALDRWKWFEWDRLKLLIAEKIPLFLLMTASIVITFISQKSAGAMANLAGIPLESRLLNIIISYAKYLVMFFYPANLGFFYPFENNFETWQLIGSVLLIASVTVFCLFNLRKRKYLAMGWFWFIGTLVPVIGFVQIGGQGMADRYTYVPYFGLFVMIIWGVGEVFNKFNLDKKVFTAIWAIIILVLSGLSFNLTSYWKNSETLYTRSLQLTEKNYFIMSNLCLHYIVKSTPEIAEARCVELLGQTPPNAEAFNILGMLRMKVGKYDEAVKNFQASTQINADGSLPYADYNLSTALAKSGNIAESENVWQKANALKYAESNKPILATTANIIGAELLKRGQTDKAIFYFTKATELQPNLAEAQQNLKKAKEIQK